VKDLRTSQLSQTLEGFEDFGNFADQFGGFFAEVRGNGLRIWTEGENEFPNG
jgi:hypothetical protein